MNTDNSFQARLDRIGQWPDFEIDWAQVREMEIMDIRDLCALSVGVAPLYVQLVRDFKTVDLEDPPTLEEFVERVGFRNALIDECFRRWRVAENHIEAGTLPAKVSYPGPRSCVKITDFTAWAAGRRWTLPNEFPGVKEAAVAQVAPGALQTGGPKRPLGPRDTLLSIIAAFLHKNDWAVNMRGLAPKIATLTDDLGAPLDDGTIRKALQRITQIGSAVGISLGTKERNSLLIIIAALCKNEGWEVPPHRGTCRQIAEITKACGSPLLESAVCEALQQTQEVVGERKS